MEDENPNGSAVGTTNGWAIDKGNYKPTTMDGKLYVTLYTNGLGVDLTETTHYYSGRNYRTFSNEMGDILYFFNNVKDKESFE